MKAEIDIAYGISARVVRRGLVKVAEVSITDGVDTWTFDTAASFTIRELRNRFPYFRQHKKPRRKKDEIPVLPGQTNIMETLENGK